jgi:hypothetical protein
LRGSDVLERGLLLLDLLAGAFEIGLDLGFEAVPLLVQFRLGTRPAASPDSACVLSSA